MLALHLTSPWPPGSRGSFGCCNMGTDVNPFTLRVTLESIVCYFYTFENNLRIKEMFAKYLNESCFVASD